MKTPPVTTPSTSEITKRVQQSRAWLLSLAIGLTVIAAPLAEAQTITTEHSFTSNLSGNGDGGIPMAGLVKDSSGNFWGTTSTGGTSQDGTVFKITTTGTYTTEHSFTDNLAGNGDGGTPLAGLVIDSSGNFWGTTSTGGTSQDGTVFKITPSGTYTTEHSFTDNLAGNGDGGTPKAGLVIDSSGNFWGTTSTGGTSQHGTVFKITPSGTYTTRSTVSPTTSPAMATVERLRLV
jgi:uncharacterized repeat protein (TIGR03803 family)